MRIFGALIPNASVREASKVEAMQKLGNEFQCRLLNTFVLFFGSHDLVFSLLFFLARCRRLIRREGRKEHLRFLLAFLVGNRKEGMNEWEEGEKTKLKVTRVTEKDGYVP